jgi:hypothetical protein
VKLVGLVSSYKEGGLVTAAIESALGACDKVFVFEGPAGAPLGDDVPDSEIGIRGWDSSYPYVRRWGEWKTDAAKRTAMVKATRGLGAGPIWGVWVDGDEVLVNGRYLRDELQHLVWQDELSGETTAGRPLRLVEMDGSVAVCRAKCVRVDLIESYIVSSSGIRFKSGATMIDRAEGNLPQKVSEWWSAERREALSEDRLMLGPPLPCEPFLYHRSLLRHPLRRGLRLHEQEADELRKMGVLTP